MVKQPGLEHVNDFRGRKRNSLSLSRGQKSGRKAGKAPKKGSDAQIKIYFIVILDAFYRVEFLNIFIFQEIVYVSWVNRYNLPFTLACS